MSWSLHINKTPKDEWDRAVDKAAILGQDVNLPGVADDVAAARQALKLLGRRVKRRFIHGSAGGHCLQTNEGAGWSDSVGVNVYGLNDD